MKTNRLYGAMLSLMFVAPAFAADDAMAPMSDGVAVATVMAVNDHEIKAANVAMKKGVSAPVMTYAKMMDTEHSDNQAKLKALADKEGVKPSETAPVKAMQEKTQAERDAMSKLEGAAFEKAYVAAMVKDHAEVLSKLDEELIPAADHPALTAHLRTTREHVAMHLEQARELAGK